MRSFQKQFIKQDALRAIRDFFIDKGFHEVETPILLTQAPLEPGLFLMKTHWQQGKVNFYLAPSPESSLKKLIAEGIGNCFAISKVFRDLEDIGPTHNLEFSLLEWYEMGKDYRDIAKTTEDLVLNTYHSILEKLGRKQTNVLAYQGLEIDLTPPWPKFTLNELLKRFAKINLGENLELSDLAKTAQQKGYSTEGMVDWEPLFSQIMANEIEPRLPKDRPVFVFDYPTQLSPLCKLCQKRPAPNEAEGFSQRFELYLGGMEIANAYTELTDAKLLEGNFKKEEEFRKKRGLPSHPHDKELIEATKNFPDCAGIALGLDRLAMLFADTSNIEDVLYFPTAKLISSAQI